MLLTLLLLASAQSALPPADTSSVPADPVTTPALLQARITELENELQLTIRQRDSAQQLLADHKAQISELQSQLSAVRRELATARANARSSNAASSDLESQISTLQAELATQKTALAAAKAHQATLENNLQQTLAALAAAQRELENAQANSLSSNEMLSGLAFIGLLLVASFFLGMYWQRARVRNRLGGLEL